jgi:hypothetical protein
MKKCLFIYGDHDINNLFDSHPSKINFHGQWIALKNLLYKKGIDLIPKNNIGLNKPNLEIHLNVWPTGGDEWPKFAILNETKYIHPDNSNLRLLKKYDKVFSWDQNLIDIGLATKIQLAHPLGEGIVDGYKNRDQFIVLFGSNRALRGWHPKFNLYRERVKTIRWFENNAPNDFSLYGKKWNLSARLSTRFGALIHSLEKRMPFKHVPFRSWKGAILDKQEVLSNSRFSIVYENIQGLKGYITEKIFDAFVVGNIPIYWGATDIYDYIPKDCFIDRRDFANHDQLYKFLKNMKEYEFINYQEAIKDFLQNKAEKFSCERFAKTIVSKIIETVGN